MTMEVDFLAAANGQRLSKSYTFDADGNLIDEQPFPFVKYVHSFREPIDDLEAFYDAIRRHAQLGHCLLKGLLDRPLSAESRAGHTDSATPTRWAMLDFDFEDGWGSVDDAIRYIAPEWSNVSYIWQHSSGAGLKYKEGLRGHAFFLLDRPQSPADLKRWLTERNFDVPQLRERIRLSNNGMGVVFPLDVTTCQNDKLLYIADPTVEGQEDPFDCRFELVRKERETAPQPTTRPTMAQLAQWRDDTVQELRKQAGLKQKKPKYQEAGTFEVLTNPERGQVTSHKINSAGYVQVNLNGGDSWGYYFPQDDPTLLFNFKEEPVVRLRDIDPDFYYRYLEALKRATQGDITPYVFRDPHSDAYHALLWDDAEGRVQYLQPISSKDRMKDFLQQYGYSLPEPVPDWQLEYNPTTTKQMDAAAQWANLFRPSDYLLKAEAGLLPEVNEVPPTIKYVLNTMCAYDEAVIEHFLNWLACLFQTRRRLGTAWVFHGTTGTGKGTMLGQIIRPLIGELHVQQIDGEHFDDRFNADLMATSLLWLDELQVSSLSNPDSIMQRLDTYITEDKFTLRAMHRNRVQTDNYMNLVVTSNYPDPVILKSDQRRFNIAPASMYKCQIGEKQIYEDIPNELEAFAGYLWHREADMHRARNIIHTEAEARMKVASQTAEHCFFDALRSGDLDYFFDVLTDKPPAHQKGVYFDYERVMSEIIEWYVNEGPTDEKGMPNYFPLHPGEVATMLNYVTDVPVPPGKIGRRLNLYKLEQDRMTDREGKRRKVLPIRWQSEQPETIREWHQEHQQQHGALKAIAGGQQ